MRAFRSGIVIIIRVCFISHSSYTYMVYIIWYAPCICVINIGIWEYHGPYRRSKFRTLHALSLFYDIFLNPIWFPTSYISQAHFITRSIVSLQIFAKNLNAPQCDLERNKWTREKFWIYIHKISCVRTANVCMYYVLKNKGERKTHRFEKVESTMDLVIVKTTKLKRGDRLSRIPFQNCRIHWQKRKKNRAA